MQVNLHGSDFSDISRRNRSGFIHSDDLFLIIRSASLADSVRSHKSSAFAAAYKRRSSHFPGSSSAVPSCFGMLIFRADRHGFTPPYTSKRYHGFSPFLDPNLFYHSHMSSGSGSGRIFCTAPHSHPCTGPLRARHFMTLLIGTLHIQLKIKAYV